MLAHEQFLAASYFGKYFARNINLYLLQRRPDEWRELQSRSKSNSGSITAIHSASSVIVQKPNPEDAEEFHQSKASKKRRSRPEDEIDAVFNTSLGAKVKRIAV